jgi:nicotinamidase-related amidase
MKTALLVIDMQNDYLWERRKPVFAYDTKGLTSAVNGLVHRYENVIYIRHLIQNLPTNRLLFGYSLAGTEGAALYGGLDVVSERVFDKYFGDALTNGALLRLIREGQIVMEEKDD